jgi:hypothetical protein
MSPHQLCGFPLSVDFGYRAPDNPMLCPRVQYGLCAAGGATDRESW